MDVVGLNLVVAIDKLAKKRVQYRIEYTVPTRDYFKVDEKIVIVVRQKDIGDGMYLLTAAAKMRKEVY